MTAYSQSGKSVAQTWLWQHGAKALNLQIADEYEEILVFEDVKNRAFAIVVTEQYANEVSNRVLAYSVGNVFSNPEGGWSRNLIESYRQQLRMLKEMGMRENDGCAESGKHVSPLLGKMNWGQKYPYNKECPSSALSNDHKLAGCVAVAISQVMCYYKYPVSGKNSFTYTFNGKKLFFDYSGCKPQWTEMRPMYSQVPVKGEEPSSAAGLVKANAYAVSSQFGDLQTSASVLHARSALVNFWGYSPLCRCDYSLNPNQMMHKAIMELDSSRPLILSGGGHAFVCDGYDSCYLHFNLGWNGAGNGYYKMSLLKYWEADNGIPPVANSMLYGIKPASGEKYLAKSVTLVKPGTLSDILTEEEFVRIKRLTVHGKLNGKDIACIRAMAGAGDIRLENSVTGVLADLDLSDAEIVADKKNAYCRMEASGCEYNIGGIEYKFSEMTEGLFKKFRKTFAAKSSYYVFVEEKNRYYVDFYAQSKTIGPMMFSDCQNLVNIKLPDNTSRILGRAFMNCNSVDEFILPESVTEIETGAFALCYLLRRVIVAREGIKEVVYGLSPVKLKSRYGEIKNNRHQGIFDGNDVALCEGLFVNRAGKLVRISQLERKEYLK